MLLDKIASKGFWSIPEWNGLPTGNDEISPFPKQMQVIQIQ